VKGLAHESTAALPAPYPWRSRRDLAVAAAVALLAPLLALRDVALSGFAAVPGDVNDGRLNAFFLEHSWGWVSGQRLHRSLWALPDFFPGGGNALAFSDAMVSFGPLYWPWRLLGLAPDTSYQLWCLAVVGVSALAGYLFLRRAASLSPTASALGTWLATCSASRLHQISHSQLLPVFYVFAALGGTVIWAREVRRPRRILAAAATAGAVVAQLYGGFYQGFFLVLVVAVLAVVALATRRTRERLLPRLRADAPALLVVALLAAGALVPWYRHYRAAESAMGGPRDWSAIVDMVPRPLTWLFMSPDALAYGWIERAPAFRRLPWWFEHTVGLGFLTTACVVAATLACRRRLAVRLTATTVVALVVLTTMVDGHTLWRPLLDAVPPLGAVRALARLGIMLPLGAAVVLGTWLDAARSRRGRAVATVLVALCGAEQLSRLDSHDRDIQRHWVEEVARRVDRHADAFVVTRSSGPGGSMTVHLDAMMAAHLTGVPTVNGASGNEPPAWQPLQWAKVRNDTAARLFRQALDEWVRGGGADPARVQWIQLPPRYRQGEAGRRRGSHAG